jgi:poly-gamma-glutamate synthesis protein (capsule biosynthesis protein)
VVAAFHWGAELDRTPSARQRSLAREALAAGATAVLGAHPHVLQPVARPAPGRLVAYSLGNFVFGANSPGTERTGVLLVGLGAGRVLGHRLLPARIRAGRPLLRDPAGAVETVGEVAVSR